MPVLAYQANRFTDPATGIVIPKDPATNLKWRADWLAKAAGSAEARADLIEACRASCVLTCNLLFWSYLKNQIDDDGREVEPISPHYPAITWPVQDRAISTIVDCIVKRDPVVSWKTREMGNSWLVLWVFTWFSLFHENMDFLVMSRTEELVDSAEDPDSLFWKIRYLIDPERMPEFIAPRSGKQKIVIKHMHVSVPRTHSHIDGRATTSHAGAGGRRNAVFFDEFSRVVNAKALWETMTDTNRCRIAISTPLQGSFHNRLYTEGRIRAVFMPWWEHPWKGRGMRWQREKPSETAMDVDGWYAVSPWYQRQVESREASDLAENVDCNPQGSSELFFAAGPLAAHERRYACKPGLRGELLYNTETDPTQVDSQLRSRIWETCEFLPDPAGAWSLWTTLVEDEATGKMRPPQDRAYVAFADISKGTGASNSTIAFYDVETSEQVAEYANSKIGPHNFARMFCAALTWFGGAFPTLAGWEANGDGLIFGDEFMKLEWPRVYFREQIGAQGAQVTRLYGWNSNTQAKLLLLGKFRSAIEMDTVKVRSADCLREAGRYIRYENGGVGPAELAEEPAGAAAAHGDRVIGSAGATMLLEKYKDFDMSRYRTDPSGSFAYRQRRRLLTEQRRRQESEW